MVKYQIQFKPVNPVTKTCVTNTTLASFDGSGITTSGGYNPNYDMMFMFQKTSSGSATVNDFVKVPQETWAIFAVAESIKGAMKIAKPLIQTYGVENVQICKVVQANIEVVFEE